MEKAGVDKVHAQDPDAFLLQTDVRVMRPDVDDHVVRWAVRGGLETHAQPAVPAVGAIVGAAGHRVREAEEALRGMLLPVQPLHDQAVFVPDHVPEPALAYEAVAGFRAVDGVAEVLVVGAHGLRDGLRGPAGAEKMADGLLSHADLSEGAVKVRVGVDAPCLLVGAQLHPLLVGGDHRCIMPWIKAAKVGATCRKCSGISPRPAQIAPGIGCRQWYWRYWQ